MGAFDESLPVRPVPVKPIAAVAQLDRSEFRFIHFVSDLIGRPQMNLKSAQHKAFVSNSLQRVQLSRISDIGKRFIQFVGIDPKNSIIKVAGVRNMLPFYIIPAPVQFTPGAGYVFFPPNAPALPKRIIEKRTVVVRTAKRG